RPSEAGQCQDTRGPWVHGRRDVPPARWRGPRPAMPALARVLPLGEKHRAFIGSVAEEELRNLVCRIDRVEPEEPAEDRTGPVLDRDGLREGFVRHASRRTAGGLSL